MKAGVAFQLYLQSEISDSFVTRKSLPYSCSGSNKLLRWGGCVAVGARPAPAGTSVPCRSQISPLALICVWSMDRWTRTLRINLSLLRSTYFVWCRNRGGCLISGSFCHSLRARDAGDDDSRVGMVMTTATTDETTRQQVQPDAEAAQTPNLKKCSSCGIIDRTASAFVLSLFIDGAFVSFFFQLPILLLSIAVSHHKSVVGGGGGRPPRRGGREEVSVILVANQTY